MNITELNKPVAENIDAIIKDKALNRPEIARRAGVSPRHLYDIIKGRQLIKAQEIKAIAEVLNVEIADLFQEATAEKSYIK